MKLAEAASGKRPKTVAIITDNTAASVASVKPMRERLPAQEGLQLVVDETFTPPLADATSLVQRVRSARPELLRPSSLWRSRLAQDMMRVPASESNIGSQRIS